MEKKLENQSPCTRENTFVRTHSLKLSGLVCEDDDNSNANALMFVRPKVVEMWNELEKSHHVNNFMCVDHRSQGRRQCRGWGLLHGTTEKCPMVART